jgi:hypothetical protein
MAQKADITHREGLSVASQQFNTSLQQQNFPTPNVNTQQPLEAFGGGTDQSGPAAALANAGNTLDDLAKQSFMAATNAANMQNKNELVTYRSNGLYGYADPNTGQHVPGVLEQIQNSGQNGHAIWDQYQQAYQSYVNDKMANLPTPQQKQYFANAASDEWDAMNKIGQTHLAANQKNFEEATYNASLENSINSGVQQYGDSDAVDKYKEEIINTAQQYGFTHGQSDAEIAAAQGNAISKMYAGVVEKYFANGQAQQGADYYDQVKDQITDSATGVKLAKLVEEGQLQQQSQQNAQQIVANHSDMNSAEAEIENIKDQKLQDETRQRVRTLMAIKDKQTQTQRDQTAMQAVDIATKTGSFDQVPLAVQQQLDPATKTAIQKLANNASGAQPIQNNDKVFQQYSSMAPAELGQVSQSDMALKVRPNLDDYHWKQVEQQWIQSREGIGGNQQALAKANQLFGIDGIALKSFTDARIAGAQAGQKYSDFQAPVRQAYDDYKSAVQNEVDTQQQLQGRALKPQEIQQISNKIATQRVFTSTPGTFGNHEQDKLLFQVPADQRQSVNVRVQNIPDSQMQALYRAGLQSGGIPLGTPYPVAVSKYKSNFEKAYGAAISGADANRVRAIMGGQ